MGSGASTFSNESFILEEVRKSYKTDPVMTTKIVNACRKEVIRLKKERYVPATEQDLYSHFQEMDYNGNNLISLAEIDKLVVEKYPQYDNKPALLRAYYAADKDNTGLITYEEFKNLWKYIVFFNNMWDKFSKYDADNDRRINVDEFHNMCGELFNSPLSYKEAVYYFNLIDTNNGGLILFKEFCTFMVRRMIALQ